MQTKPQRKLKRINSNEASVRYDQLSKFRQSVVRDRYMQTSHMQEIDARLIRKQAQSDAQSIS